MHDQTHAVRYWCYDGPMPADVAEGRMVTGVAYHVDRKERVVSVRVLAQGTGETAWEMWLDRTTARELVASLGALDPWFGPDAAADDGRGGEA